MAKEKAIAAAATAASTAEIVVEQEPEITPTEEGMPSWRIHYGRPAAPRADPRKTTGFEPSRN